MWLSRTKAPGTQKVKRAVEVKHNMRMPGDSQQQKQQARTLDSLPRIFNILYIYYEINILTNLLVSLEFFLVKYNKNFCVVG